jgi:hypothetical protein
MPLSPAGESDGARSVVAAAAVLGAAVALGLAICGIALALGLYRARAAERFVTVKGLSEREVAADVALWPIVFTNTADDLESLQRQVDEDMAVVAAYLGEHGFTAEEWTQGAPRITDFAAQHMGRDLGVVQRYQAESVVALRTSRIDGLRQALAASGQLVTRGVALIRSYEYNTQYLYTQLEAIKPEMIAEATRDARRAAEQFAEDSGSRVGAIRRAQQGYFSVEDRDAFSPETKRVRVVTTVDYFLED